MTLITLPREQFLLKYRESGGQKPAWYVKYLLRGFTDAIDIFINKDGIFIGKRDYDLVIAHEEGHIQGKEHTLFGVMSAYGLIRLLTV
jgi:hypothetical protein